MYEKIIVNIIDQLIGAHLIQKEAFCTECIKTGIFDGVDISSHSATQKVVDYLNAHNNISNTNLTNWCIKHNIQIRSYLTLESCLRQGAYTFKQRRGNRIYYCKGSNTVNIAGDMICLK